MSAVSTSVDQICINTIRGLAMDAVQKANSGHPGMPMGAAAFSHVLWTRHLKHDPSDPKWINRDRFVLSAGHGSMLLYALLHLTGYDLPMSEIERFRQLGSATPGHPENTHTRGVEMATGPLGQGFGTAVGMAIAEAYLAATFNRPGHTVMDHFTYVICSDGDLMEGISQEAASLAGHLQLGKLIYLYDDNQVTIDGATDLAFSDDTTGRFESMGWHVQDVCGNDLDAVDRALRGAQAEGSKPSLIRCRTTIGFGSPNRAGTSKAHGSPLGPDEVALTKQHLGIPQEPPFYVAPEALEFYRQAVDQGARAHNEWEAACDAYRQTFPELGRTWDALVDGDFGKAWMQHLPSFAEAISTRQASDKVIQSISDDFASLLGGSADLTENVFTAQRSSSPFSAVNRTGRNLYFGVREHAMATTLNGITLHGGCKAFGGTFLTFSDYCRPAIRLAALMRIPTTFVFSHDSIGLGEDGPTHQPIEHVMSLRLIPNLNVLRPADGNETAVCWRIALESKETPCALILTRQAVPVCTPDDIDTHPARCGGYVLAEATAPTPHLVLLATGSEVHVALAARETLETGGIPTRVVSLPSWFVFEQQEAAYRQRVLPPGVPCVSVEAGATTGWSRYAHAHVGIDRYGESAPAAVLFAEFGFTADNVAQVARNLLAQRSG